MVQGQCLVEVIVLKICAYLPIYKREGLLAETLRRLKHQTLSFERIVTVGSCDEDKEIAKKFGVDYIGHENHPLSDKIQAGVSYLRQFKPDAIMGIGSDDWVTSNWVEEVSKCLGEFDIIGADHFYLFLVDSKPIQLIRYCYPSSRYGEPMGAGRFVSRRILDKLDWRLYPRGFEWGLDGKSHSRMVALGATYSLYRSDKAKILCPKGIQGQLTTWDHAINSDRSKKIDDKHWISTNFPGVVMEGSV